MTSVVSFVKMHGLGNDFIIIDDHRHPSIEQSPINAQAAQWLCDRHFGIGADQILWLVPPKNKECHVQMRIFNSDGSESQMCGNGLRAVALYLRKAIPEMKPQQDTYLIETLTGVQTAQLLGATGDDVRVHMGIPQLVANPKGELLRFGEKEEKRFFEVTIGNPHVVFLCESVEKIPLEEWGPQIERHSRFPERTNVEFVEVVDSHTLRVRVWERGAGVTLACGSGACASAVVGISQGLVQSPVEVKLPGGSLIIDWLGKGQPVNLQGTAQWVYEGKIPFGK